ncbi:M56 family metallopeptidase [Mangrovimonas cancribranchiae]|uniref:M56 family metallopeptidase n=1 Tax=Mangrovimonas cancribranchiae TaxID=3080055 RepID=A0AAU6P2S8_9FLAO
MEYLLKSSAIIVLFYLCYKIFLQQETFFESNRWFLLTGLIFAVITPFISIPIYIEYTPIDTSNFLITNTATPQTAEKGISLINILTWVYFTGLATLGIKLILEFKALFTVLTKTDKNIKGNYTYITTSANIPPFSFFRWIAYNPTQFNKTELKHIINHEKVHAKQLHSIDVIIAQIATVLLWWNPFIWLYKKEIKQNLEFIADKKAQDSSNCEKSYQMLLVKTSTTNNHQLVMTNNFYNSLIKKRIVMLHKSKSSKLKAWKYTLILPALALFLMSFNTKKVYIKKDANLKSHVISSATTNSELNNIEEQLSSKNISIKFSDIARNQNNLIERISLQTKRKDESTFTKNITISKKSPKNAIATFSVALNASKTNVIVTTEKPNESTIAIGNGTTSEFKENKKPESHGKNPIYEINGKTYKKENLNNTSLKTKGSITQLSKKESIAKYGEIGKEGAIVFNGKTTTDIEAHIITKDFTEADFNTLKATLEKNGLKAKFKGIKRNSKGEIIAIKIDIKSDNANANYSISNNTPIQPIQIKYNTNGDNISIGNANLVEKIVVNKNGNNIKFNTKDDDKKVFIVKTDDDKNIKKKIIVKKADDIIFTNKEKKIIELKSNDKNDDEQEVEIIEIIEEDSPNTDEEKEIIIIKEDKSN